MTKTKVEQLAAYALRAQYEELSAESKKQISVHILDSLGCQIAAMGANPVNACREQVQEFSPSGQASLIAGGTSSPVYAAFWHTALVRYVDAMDNILAPTETAHTADNFGGILTAADLAITTKEQADHSLPYLLAVAILDKQVMQAQFTPERINLQDVQTLMQKVTVEANEEFTKRYPTEFCAKMTLMLKDGTSVTNEVKDYPGMPCRPFTWEDAVDKFDRMTTGYITSTQQTKIKDIVRTLETRQVRELMDVLNTLPYQKAK